MYAFEKLLKESDLTVTDLPKDAQIGIKSIKQIENAIRMTEKRGQNVSQAVRDKIQANDKWVVREILDFIEDNESQFADLPNPATEVIPEITQETQETQETPQDPTGIKVDNELMAIFETGEENEFTSDELRTLAKNTYSVIFNNYNEDEDNGVQTSNYKLVESQPEVFTLTKI